MNDIYFLGLLISAFMLSADAKIESFWLWVVWEITWLCIAFFFGEMLSRKEEEDE